MIMLITFCSAQHTPYQLNFLQILADLSEAHRGVGEHFTLLHLLVQDLRKYHLKGHCDSGLLQILLEHLRLLLLLPRLVVHLHPTHSTSQASIQSTLSFSFTSACFTSACFASVCFTSAGFTSPGFTSAFFSVSLATSFLGSAFFGSSFLGSSFLGSTFFGSSFLGSSFLGSSFLGSSFLGSTFFGSSFFVSSFFVSSFFGSAFLGSSFLISSFLGYYFFGSSLGGALGGMQLYIYYTQSVYQSHHVGFVTNMFCWCLQIGVNSAMRSLGFDVRNFRVVQQMKKSNLYLYSLENKAALPYHECSIEINSNLYLPDQHDNLLGLVSKIDTLEHQKGVERVDEFARYGCLFKIHKADVKGGYLIFERTKVFTVTYTGITFARFKIISLTRQDGKVYANVEIFADQLLRETENALERKGLVANFKKEMKLFYQCKMRPTDADALKAKLDLEKSVNKMVYRCAEEISLPTADKLKFLQIHRHEARLEYLISVLTEKTENLKNVVDIEDNVRQEMQKSSVLRKIRPATGNSSPVGEVEALSERIKNAKLPNHVREEILKQMKRLGGHESQQAVTLKYIETLLDIPWLESTEEVKDILQAERILQSEHTGLKDVKERILQFLSVRFRNGNCKGNVICLHGPPGVGKTSIAKSIAKALGKQFTRVSLGGMNDEAELRGHRRTYVAALPGVIVRALIKAKSNNPVILLDEIQKMGASYKGNPEHALLEILDPSQNSSFVDHYVSIPVDLSKVVFICTANSLELSGPLINRLELIEVPGYSREEKLQIAQNHLVPLQKKDNGVEDLLQFETQALQEVIRYCNQLGVRQLERKIAKICRKTAREGKKIKVTKEHVEAILGKRYEAELWRGVGVANGMAWTQLGGKLLTIEAIQYKAGTPKIEVTGQLGDVMKESVKIALSWLRANLEDLAQVVGYAAVPSEVLEKISLHLHFPEGATKKDGPSAGVTIVACIASLLLKTPVRENLAMTGEITLSGRVLAVGGVRQKCIAAIYCGIKHIIIPAHNLKDLQKIDSKLRKGVQFYPVKHIREALMVAFPELLKEIAPKI